MLKNGSRNVLLLLLLLFSLLTLNGCNKKEVPPQENIKNVGVKTIQEEITPVNLTYAGVVNSDQARALAFKTSGKVVEIYVDENDYVKAGTVIALLDQEVTNYQVKASQGNLKAAQLDYDKAKDSYLYAEDLLKKTQQLYEAGAVSKDAYTKTELSTQAAKITMDQAQVKIQQLNEDYNLKTSNLNDTRLVADMSGYILSVNYKAGDIVPAGMPIVKMDNGERNIVLGLAEADLKKVKKDMDVQIKYQEKEMKGKVSLIYPAPDPANRTYPVEIAFAGEELPLGANVETRFNLGEAPAIWVPLNAIIASTIDYVYVVQEDKAVKKAVKILEVEGTRAKIQGLSNGDKLVIKGMKSIEEGNRLQIVD